MLHRKQYEDKLNEEMQVYIDLMKKCWGEAPELNPKVEVILKVSMDFDLGDFPHKGQSFFVSPDKKDKLAPDKVAKKIVQEINSHRNACNRCGVPTPHIWSRQYPQSTRLIGHKNYRTGLNYTEEDLMLYDVPSDELERKLHPMISGRVDKRLRKKAEAEKNSPEAYDKEMDAWFGTSC